MSHLFFNERELMLTFAICYRQSICLSSVTFMHPTQAVFLCHWVPWPSIDMQIKFYGDRPRGTLHLGHF